MNTKEVTPAISSRTVDVLRKMNHDLRNPLNSLLATTDMLEEGVYESLTDQQLKAVQRVERSAKRVLTVLDYTVDYLKADSGGYPLATSEFDPRALVAGIKAECQPIADAQQIVVSTTTTDTVPRTIIGDESVLRQIILELVWNAISFSPPSTVEIISDWSHEWVVTVKDVGPGIPASARPGLFEPFRRGKVVGTHVPTSGSGLGLAMSEAFARLMQGRLVFEENGDKGSSFTLCLPLGIGPQ